MHGPGRTTASLTVRVHGPTGLLDLVVPPGASAAEVATEYAVQAGLADIPRLQRLHAPLAQDRPLADLGVRSGELLVATVAGHPAGGGRDEPANRPAAEQAPEGTGSWPAVWFAVAASTAVLAACFAVRSEGPAREATAAILALAALVATAPLGRFAAPRLLAAPAFAGAAAFVLAWAPAPETVPVTVGATALVAAVAAGVGHALDRQVDEGLRVWMIAGVVVFVVGAAVTLAGAPPQVAWAVLLLGAVLMARFVPSLAVDVPDDLLVDRDRLAVTAWSAREQPTGRRGRMVVPVPAVRQVAARGSRLVSASCAAILAVAAVSAPLLLVTTRLPIDRLGARLLVGFGGAGLLLAARSYRHPAARALLRTAGLVCWAVLLGVLLRELGRTGLTTVAVSCVLLAVLLVVVAVAIGRGWRSVWWARRAEVAEALAGSCAVASLVVAVGIFRRLWETTS